jgi:RNA polymerase sigma factor (sigma-70 family)
MITETSNEGMIKKYKACKNVNKKIEIRNALLEKNMGLIHKMVSIRLKGFEQDHGDVVNMAAIKFFKAIDGYEFGKGAKFSTYVRFWIDAAIYDFWHSKNVINIPKSIDLKEGGAGHMAINSRLVWLDKDLTNSDDRAGSTFMDIIANEKSSMPDIEVLKILEDDKMNRIIELKLDRAEQLVIKYRYLSDPSVNVDDLSKMLKLHTTKVQVLERTALMKLRKILRNQPAHYHVPIRKDLPSDEEIKAFYNKLIRSSSNV